MRTIYNFFLTMSAAGLRLVAWLSFLLPTHSKLRKLAVGQRRLWQEMENALAVMPEGEVIWMHASSLGEYGVARPVIRRLRQERPCRIVLTFFSPTGYEALHRWHPDEECVFYLPWDTRSHASRFLDRLRPQKAVFFVSEYWVNYLMELKARQIPTFLVSGLIGRKAPFMRWYGGVFRRSLEAYTHFMVLDEASAERLRQLGHTRVTVTGDPLFDNVLAVASTPWTDPVVERFAAQGDLFIAGSISDSRDRKLVCTLANSHRDVRFIFVPHEICEENLNALKFELDGCALCYSECDEQTDFRDTQVLIIDFLGALAYLYRYGKWAYVGGGFTPYLHSLIEATVYGLPVAFGPEIHRKVTPNELISLGIGQIVRTPQDMEQWFSSLKEDEAALSRIRETARQYARRNGGATAQITQILTEA